MKSYGLTQIDNNTDEISYHVENLRIRGYSILKKVVSESDCDSFNSKTEDLYKQQCNEFHEDDLIKILFSEKVAVIVQSKENLTELFTKNGLEAKLLGKIRKHLKHQLWNSGKIKRKLKKINELLGIIL